MHKVREPSSAPPFRPIVSSIGTYNYNLAKFLCTLLDSHIPRDFCARGTFSFVNEITNLRTSNKFMVSFDVESLFTNIPLLESFELAVDYILAGNPNIKAVFGLSLHQGSTESRKIQEQKFIFQIGTLNPHGINERFSLN